VTFNHPAALPAERPRVPGATASLALGIICVAGVVVLVPVFLAPLAWYHGMAARRRIERDPRRWSGAGEARAGMVLGMIGTGLMGLVLGVLLLAGLGMLVAARWSSGYSS